MIHLDDPALQELADSGAADPHVDSCATCKAEIAAIRLLTAQLSQLGDPEPPRDLLAGVMRRIERDETAWRAALALLVMGAASLYALVAMAPGRPSAWQALQGFGLAARVVRGALLSFSGAPLLATALLVLVAVLSIHRLTTEART